MKKTGKIKHNLYHKHSQRRKAQGWKPFRKLAVGAFDINGEDVMVMLRWLYRAMRPKE